MLHVERLLALRELRAIVDVWCVYEPVDGFNGRSGVRGAMLYEARCEVWWSRKDSGYLTRKRKTSQLKLTVGVGWRKKKVELARGKRYMWTGSLHFGSEQLCISSFPSFTASKRGLSATSALFNPGVARTSALISLDIMPSFVQDTCSFTRCSNLLLLSQSVIPVHTCGLHH